MHIKLVPLKNVVLSYINQQQNGEYVRKRKKKWRIRRRNFEKESERK